MPSLEEINIENNKLNAFRLFAPLNAKDFPKFNNLSAKENPCCDEAGDSARKQILMYLEHLKIIDGEPVTKEELEEMRREFDERKDAEDEKLKEIAAKLAEVEAERQRIAAEEAERLAKERAEEDERFLLYIDYALNAKRKKRKNVPSRPKSMLNAKQKKPNVLLNKTKGISLKKNEITGGTYLL